MQCINPPALSDEALSLVLDNMADEETLTHLAQCSACTSRLETMRQFENTLKQRLSRSDCPPSHDLTEYQMGMLKTADVEIIREHIAQCPRCQIELEMLKDFMNLPSEIVSVPDNIIPLRQPKSLTRTTRVEVSGNLALKGGEDEISHDMQSGSARVFLESKTLPTGFSLTGQVIDHHVDWRGAIAEARQGGMTQQVCILDDMCEFSFELSTSAPVTLAITASNGVTLMVENITFQT